MSFVEDAETWRVKLHVGKARVPVLVGITACCLLLVAAAVGIALDAFDGKGAIVEKAPASISEEGTESSVVPREVIVHVSGSVVEPGVYRITESSRVGEAIEVAGGAAEDADLDALNLARILVDGEHVIVPSVSVAPGYNDELTDQPASFSGSSDLVNINRATVSELDVLPGIGASTAEKIVADRETNGPFRTKEDLKRVAGIGDKKYDALCDLIVAG